MTDLFSCGPGALWPLFLLWMQQVLLPASCLYCSPYSFAQVAGMTWFGGGCDLTPFYLDEEDVTAFHKFWK